MRAAIFSLGLFAGLSRAGVLNKRAVLVDCLAEAGTAIDAIDSQDWERDTRPFNSLLAYKPDVVAVPTTTEQIQNAVLCGAKSGYKVTPKCGGHSYASYGLGGEDGHLVIQLDRMFAVKLDTKTNIATAEAGTRLGHLAVELWAQGKRAISHGTCPGVGIGGHALHGGFGLSSHTHGLALDWIIGLNVVLANGTLVHTSATENSDLFWGMLGAGSNFGVVTSFELNTFAPPANLTWFVVNLPLKKETAVAALEALEDYTINTMPAELNMRIMGTPRMTQLEGIFHGDKAGLQNALAPLLSKTGGNILATGTTDWPGSLSHFATMSLNQTHPHNEQETFYGKSLELTGLSGDAAQDFVNYWFDHAKSVSGAWYFQLDLQGGKNSGVWNADHAVSSYAHRDKLYLLQFFYRSTTKAVPPEAMKLVDEWTLSTIKSLAAPDYGMYINYPDLSLNRTAAHDMYWGKSMPKLQQLKAQLDPQEVFYYPISIKPGAAA
ncbi:FAD binding domain-containing protein [Xylaria bambusicola]|uniref:FAD binding domain-containing protein n=1 Tax=Xylaria bambusicola TaxID=326684 RepID=UPI00200768C4|nr:FAD binding domain-containing protein [Xylaria bambusicola]KAI0517504.1 FAD binding domain-containing protein [Xylaria bambusicola]